jgi:hypothetical protein
MHQHWLIKTGAVSLNSPRPVPAAHNCGTNTQMYLPGFIPAGAIHPLRPLYICMSIYYKNHIQVKRRVFALDRKQSFSYCEYPADLLISAASFGQRFLMVLDKKL